MQRIDWAHTAVVGVHWQHEVVSPDGVFGPFFADQVARHGVTANAAGVAAAARAAGGLVVFTRVAYRPGYPDLIANPSFAMIRERGAFLEGDPKTRIVEEVGRQPGDVVVTSTRLGGFSGTELDLILRGRGVRTVVFTGVATNLAVAATAYQAVDQGYRIVTVSDACTAATDELHDAYLSTLGQLGEVAATGEIA
ncbi:cysteine hydrolase family protein [Micromonospora sp. C28ISP2-4]|uniref:cysteine hydrolase family protein n=1 Tax=Micromonospora sp. C28ISP2-4 TaxID=3059523 RepID=UPI002674BB86|nr:cysteine hydrolase [Micromonospora sp. C28ISP2-4]MDO3686832.1 cysteine hydrolase [Micromonospora sp. C28ISP2-4]